MILRNSFLSPSIPLIPQRVEVSNQTFLLMLYLVVSEERGFNPQDET